MDNISAEVLSKLMLALESRKNDGAIQNIVNNKNNVVSKYQLVFSPSHIAALTADEFKSFLLPSNNKHWNGLFRSGNKICGNMNTLKKGLTVLLDESKPINERFDNIIKTVPGMGRAIATAILLVSQPDRYGVWNGTSETGLKNLGIWPDFNRGETIGSMYKKVNELLLKLSNELKIDLWTLDAIWWDIISEEQSEAGEYEVGSSPKTYDGPRQFGLEKYLHDFIFENWEKIDLSKDWTLYKRDEADDQPGYKYPASPVGIIDILAKHKTNPSWLVIELKRGQTGDETVGQTCRYITWVKEHLASQGETVNGLIVCHEPNIKLIYASKAVPNVDVMTYEIEFRLNKLAEA